MPASAYAKVLLALNGGGNASGGITASPGDIVHLSGESSAYWDHAFWEIYNYPAGWAVPAGWTAQGGAYVSSAITPPAFTLPALPVFGKWLIRLTVDSAMTGGLAAPTKVDQTTAVQTLSTNGLRGVAAKEEAQFDANRSWAGGLEQDIITLDGRLTTLSSGFSLAGQQAGDLIAFNGTVWAPLHAGADRKVLVSTGPTTAPVWAYPSETTYDWGRWGNCVAVFNPADATLNGVSATNIDSLIDSSPLYPLGAARNSQVAQGSGFAQKAASADFNNYPVATFDGSNIYYGGIISGTHFFGDTFNFAVGRYTATNVAPYDYTMFWAVRLDAQAAPAGAARPIDYPALLEADGGGVGTYFNGGNIYALASATNASASIYYYDTASVPFAIGAKKVICQRYTGGATKLLQIRDGLGAWASVSSPQPLGTDNIQVAGTWTIGANGPLNRFFNGAIGYGVIYRASLPDWQCEANIKQLLGRFRW